MTPQDMFLQDLTLSLNGEVDALKRIRKTVVKAARKGVVWEMRHLIANNNGNDVGKVLAGHGLSDPSWLLAGSRVVETLRAAGTEREDALIAFDKSGIGLGPYCYMASVLFRHAQWTPGYGGLPWAEIARMASVKDVVGLIPARHNNGFLLTKAGLLGRNPDLLDAVGEVLKGHVHRSRNES